MRKHTFGIVVIIFLLSGTGCNVSRSQDGRWATKWRIWDSVFDSLKHEDPQDSSTDQLWRNGYGFNNPNVDRRRQGLPLENFDGSVSNN